MPGVGADHNLKLDLVGSSKSPRVWMFGTYVQSVLDHEWATEATRMHKCTGGFVRTPAKTETVQSLWQRNQKKKSIVSHFHH